MKLIEPAQKPVQKEGFNQVLGQIQKRLSFGKAEENAEEDIIAQFMRGLNNRYVMVRDLPIDDAGEKFPLILVGPTGLILINVSSARGFFKAREDTWWEMSQATQRYNPGKPNLIKQSQEYAQKLDQLLNKHEKSHPEIVPVLLFANPGVNIESTNPAVRIVLMDGIDSLISAIQNSEEVLGPSEINYLADSFEFLQNPEKAIPMGEGEDFFGRDLFEPEEKAPFKLPKIKVPKLSLSGMDERLKFSPRQWLIIEVLMILLILILLAAIIYVLIVY
jgi:hypothetical protein